MISCSICQVAVFGEKQGAYEVAIPDPQSSFEGISDIYLAYLYVILEGRESSISGASSSFDDCDQTANCGVLPTLLKKN